MWHKGLGVTYEADSKHAATIIRKTGAECMKPLSTPIAKDIAEPEKDKAEDVRRREDEGRIGQKEKPEEKDLLEAAQATLYRGLAATLNYLAADRCDLAYAARECARDMATPTWKSWDRMIRVGRYLKARPRVRVWYRYQEVPETITTYSDTDWAGCKRTRRSTTGGYSTYGTHLIKAWCKTQATVALSSAEAELYGLVRASAETIGLMSMFADLGCPTGGRIMGDASAALAIIARRGIGRIRHLDTNYLWVQEQAAKGKLAYEQIAGKRNGGDLFTKPLSWEDISGHVSRIKGEFINSKDQPIDVDVFGGGALAPPVLSQVCSLARKLGMKRPVAWHRGDIGSKTTKTSMRGGTSWEAVKGRVTADAATGEVIKTEASAGITRNTEHALLPEGPRDIITVLLYESSIQSAGFKSGIG